jgi:phospholipid-binding lipoprotein MlaA
VIDPFTWVGRGKTGYRIASWSKTAIAALDTRSRLLDAITSVKKTALDPYATFRSLYRQNRAGKLQTLQADNRATVPIWWPQGKTSSATSQSQSQTTR